MCVRRKSTVHEEELLEANFQDFPIAYPLQCYRMGKKSKANKVVIEDKKMDEEKEECARCGSKFQDKESLEKHVRESHEYECCVEGWGLRSEWKREIEEHEREGHGIGIKCVQCEERFKSKNELEQHKKIKPEERCDRCCRKYILVKELRAHMRKEHGIGFNCGKYDEDFFFEVELEEHMEKVNGCKGYQVCSKCDRRFENAEDFKEHI